MGKLAVESIGSGPNAWNQTFVPYWDKANSYIVDSLPYIELPALKHGDMGMSTQSINPSGFNFGTSRTLSSLIIVNKNGNFYMYVMTLLADSTYVNGSYSKIGHNTYLHKDKDFSGNIYYHRMDGSFVNGWRFDKGQVTGIITLAPPGTPAGPITQSKDKKIVNVLQETDCETTVTTTYWANCEYSTADVTYSNPKNCTYYTTQSSYTECTTIQLGGDGGTGSSGGASSNQNPCTPSPADSSWGTPVDALRFRVRVSDPNPPGNPQPPGGIVDQTNNIGTSNCTNNDPPSDITKLTPCALLKHIDSLMQNTNVAGVNNQIFNDIYTQREYAIGVNFASFPPNGTYTPSSPQIGGTNNVLITSFKWTGNAHTIDISHDHPQGDGPSPADVFSLFVNSVDTGLQNAGVAQLNYYKNNEMITTVTNSETYIITGTNYNTLQNLYTQYKTDTAAFNNRYRDSVSVYQGNFSQALLSMFGNSINLYTSFNNKQPYTLNQLIKSKLVQANCP